MSVVFDSSAVLAIAFGEHGADRAADAPAYVVRDHADSRPLCSAMRSTLYVDTMNLLTVC